MGMPIEKVALLGMAAVISFMMYDAWSEDAAFTKYKDEVTQREELRTAAAYKAELSTITSEATHKATIKEAVNVHNEKETISLNAAAVELSRYKRLLNSEQTRFAAYRKEASGNALACGGLEDRLKALDRNTVDGIRVVGELRNALDRRDKEVELLRSVIDSDRLLLKGGD